MTIFRCWSKQVSDISLHIGDIPIGDHHQNMPECDVGDWYLMLLPRSDIDDVTAHQDYKLRVTNMLVTDVGDEMSWWQL